MNQEFQQQYERVLEEAKAIRGSKSNDYNLSMPSFPIFPDIDIPEYAVFGVMSLFQMVWTKTLRLLSLIRARRIGAEQNETVEDTCLDLINYTAFLVAYIRMRKAGQFDKAEGGGGERKRKGVWSA